MLCLCASVINRPFPSSPRPLYQNEVKYAVFNMEMNFHPHANKTHFHQKGCALDLILKVRILRTRKWPIHVRVGINIAGKIAALESAASTSTSTILKYHCVPPSATLLEMSNFSFIFYHLPETLPFARLVTTVPLQRVIPSSKTCWAHYY